MAAKFSRPTYDEPLPRYRHIAGNVDGNAVVQGGRTGTFSERRRYLSSIVDVFDPYSELWERRQVEGDVPLPETYAAASASLHNDLFLFGGFDGEDSYFNHVYKLDTKTCCWSQVSPRNVPGAPMPKAGCGMIALRNSLVVFGGYGTPQGGTNHQLFIKSTRFIDGRGWTNELHIYNLSKGIQHAD